MQEYQNLQKVGRDHPSALTSVSNLASVLGAQGKYEAAEEMNRRALEGYEKVLGKDHPSTLMSVNSLALALRAQGKYEAAEEMNRRALEGRPPGRADERPTIWHWCCGTRARTERQRR